MIKTDTQKKLEAANLRVLAAQQRQMAAAYYCQAAKPIYPSQDLICQAKGDQALAFAARSEAQANLLEAD